MSATGAAGRELMASAREHLWVATAGERGDAHLVLVHGTLDRSAGMLKLSRRLDSRFTVARYDRRGYGRSRPHSGPYGIEQQVDDLVEVIQRTSPGPETPCVVIGHSYGGNVGLAAVDRHPGLVSAVVTYETPLSWLAWWDDAGGGDAAVRDRDPEQAAEQFMRRLIGDARWERLPPATREARRAEGRAMVAELTDLRRRPPWDPARVSVPVLCLHGELGRPHHRRGARTLGEMLPDATVDVIARAHHFGPNTHPDQVAARVTGFVDRVVHG